MSGCHPAVSLYCTEEGTLRLFITLSCQQLLVVLMGTVTVLISDPYAGDTNGNPGLVETISDFAAGGKEVPSEKWGK